jgi:hypothetical protein
MRRLSLSFFVVSVLAPCTHAAVITAWDFNSQPPDADTGTGSTSASYGSGTASLIGGVGATFATGCTNDPAPGADNTGWNTKSYASQGTSNKLAGVQFNVSTEGYSDIVIRWDHRVSSAASKYCRLQYATDGVNFTDFPTPNAARLVVASKGNYFEAQTNSLAAFPAVNGNPNFAFRLVSEFESSATGSGADEYVPTFSTNSYSRSGTIRFDLVMVLGSPLPGANTPPSISSLAGQTLRVNQSTAALPFTIADAEDGPDSLVLSKSSSDPGVIPVNNIVFGGSGGARTVTLAAAGQPGTATVTLTVTDTGGKSASTSFVVTVLPANTAPFISSIPATNTLVNTPAPPLAFTVGDAESDAGSLTVTGWSANPALLPNTPANILLNGSGSNRTVTLTPAPDQTGVAPLTLTVSDGTNTASSLFALLVLPSPSVVLFDPFAYPDGSVLTNSGFLWDNRSGTLGQCQVTNGQLQISSSQTEDVAASLAGGPYARSNHTVLYASFTATFLSFPKNTPSYFAHFVGGSSLRGRLYAGTTNALSGFFHVFVANGSDATTMVVANLSTNIPHTFVTRYDVDAASTTLWINPTAESDPSVTATDPQSAVSISSYGFRQDAGLGATVLVDDLRVGLTFAAVMPPPPQNSPGRLSVRRLANNVVLGWTNAICTLQAAATVKGPFTNIPGASSPFTNPASGTRFFRLRGN